MRIRSIGESFHEETKPAALKRDESHVNLMREHVKQRITNPFYVASHPKSLVNISTGLHAPTEIEVALTNAFDNGIKMVKAFTDRSNSHLSSKFCKNMPCKGPSDKSRLLPYNTNNTATTF
jgi:hypothetical protein